MQLALYQPDIPQNVGSIMRLSACLRAPLSIIEPCGFPFDDKKMKRAAMDYYEHAAITRHASWDAFTRWRQERPTRVVLFTTKGATPLYDFRFQPEDILLFGQESRGVPQEVQEYADARVVIPLNPATRSLNVAMAAAIALGESLRQTAAA